MGNFELDTEIVDRDLAILNEMAPGFAVPVSEAIEHHTINMNSWFECIMAITRRNVPAMREKYSHPENLSRDIAQTYYERFGMYPEYEDEHENHTNNGMTYTEVVAFCHETEVVEYLKTALQKYL